MKIAKKPIILIISLIVIVSLLIILGLRVKLYIDYSNSLEKIKDFHHETLKFEGELQEDSVIFDKHLYFSLDNSYHLLRKTEKFADYQFKDENKYIGIVTTEETIKDLVQNFHRDTALSKEKAKSILKKYEFSNVTEVFLYAIDQYDRKKISIFSTKEEIEEGIFFNNLLFQQFIQARTVVDGNSIVNVINGNVNGIEILDGIFQISNGQKSYRIAFVGQHNRKEIERFMKSVHIK